MNCYKCGKPLGRLFTTLNFLRDDECRECHNERCRRNADVELLVFNVNRHDLGLPPVDKAFFLGTLR